MAKTFMQKSGTIMRAWHIIDLEDKILGRVATDIARLLIGKHKATYTPHIDAGDYVVALNASKISLSGNKLQNKKYQSHSGRPGGFKERTLSELMTKDATKVIERAVKGMLPKNKLQTPRLRRLKVYLGSEHPHTNHLSKEQ